MGNTGQAPPYIATARLTTAVPPERQTQVRYQLVPLLLLDRHSSTRRSSSQRQLQRKPHQRLLHLDMFRALPRCRPRNPPPRRPQQTKVRRVFR